MTKDDIVIFDFIQCKMLKLSERVIYAGKLVCPATYDDEDDDIYYKVITCDHNGTIRKYIKFLNKAIKPDAWQLMNTM